jgi:hypothetical protein
MDEREATHRPESGAPPPWDEWNGGGSAGPRGRSSQAMPDLSWLFALFDALRRAVPDELQDQLNALQRELLLTIRALIDWRLEQLEAPKGEPRVEEIPIE